MRERGDNGRQRCIGLVSTIRLASHWTLGFHCLCFSYESDQKIWLLAHLLSPRSVANNAPRDTVKVLQRLSTEFAAEAVAGVLRVLLSERRRHVVKVRLAQNERTWESYSSALE